jgi:hypothetical protein
VYSLWGYDELATLTLSRELSLRDYVSKYWVRFLKHLNSAPEADTFRQILTAYFIAKSPSKSYYKSMDFKKSSRCYNRLAKRAKNMCLDVISFFEVHNIQYWYFKISSSILLFFILKNFPDYCVRKQVERWIGVNPVSVFFFLLLFFVC